VPAEICGIVPIGHEDHSAIAVTPAVSRSDFHQPLDLGLSKIFTGAQVAIGQPSATGLGTAFRRNFADFSDRLQDSRPRKRQTVDHPSPYRTRALFAMTTADVGSAYRHWDGSEHKHG